MPDRIADSGAKVVGGDVARFRSVRDELFGGGLDVGQFAFGPDQLVYEGTDLLHTDDTVESDTFYTYVLAVEADGLALERRWTQTLTVDDSRPPTPVTGLEAEVTAEGVLVRWEPSSDDVEFAAYAVWLLGDGGELRYLGGGADEAQTSFLDPRPASGTLT